MTIPLFKPLFKLYTEKYLNPLFKGGRHTGVTGNRPSSHRCDGEWFPVTILYLYLIIYAVTVFRGFVTPV